MRLGIDIDNVLFDVDAAARDILLGNPPEELTLAQRTKLQSKSDNWDSIEEIVGPKNWSWLWDIADETEMFLRDYVDSNYAASRSAAALLAKKHDVWLITSRPKHFAWQTFEWLGGLKPAIQARGVIHWGNKVKVAKSLDLEVVVDDKAETLQKYVTYGRGGDLRGLYVYGVRQPWNSILATSYYRFKWIDNLGELLPEQERWTA